MSGAQHTPGPWRQVINRDKTINVVGPHDDDYSSEKVALINGKGVANARLIAAAPDLLAALEGLLAECKDHEVSATGQVVFDKAHFAIAKATGA